LFDTLFAFVHLGGLLAALVFAFLSLAKGNVPRFLLILALLAIYYIFMLHPAVKKEIARRRSLKK
jgi:Ca2+/Na+ antiporter